MGDCDPGWSGGLAVVDPRGRLTKDLSRFKGFLEEAPTAPKWSPGGRRIAFEVWDLTVGFAEYLSLMNRDGSRVRRITPAKILAEDPAWSPDGRWIAFSASQPSSFDGLGLFIIRPDGTGLHRLPGTKPTDLAPSWFPKPWIDRGVPPVVPRVCVRWTLKHR
jgi:dipeptidyl aminopeptidase/acylaminoacyl peptidase